MFGLVLRRGRDLVIVLLLVGTAMFFILHLIPGSPATSLLGPYATQSQIHDLNEKMGLDRPLFVQYVIWLGNLLHGDLGYSTSQSESVAGAIAAYIGPTLILAIAATVIGIVISVPMAIQTVARPTSWWSRLFIGASSLGLSIPGFWLALMLILFLAVKLTIFPVSGYVSPLKNLPESVWYLTLPIVVILAQQVSLLVMTLREGLAGELLNPYIRTARAKGVIERRVLYRHVFPNAMLPAVTVIGGNFGAMLGGIVIVETVFLIPGIGYAMYNAILSRDYNLVLGITLVTAVIFVLVNMIVDIIYSLLDPRVRVR